MKLSNSIQNALNEMGYHFLLPIQEKVIPMIQDGKSLFVLAKTGSGKTPCYRNVKAKLGAITRIDRASTNSVEKLPPIQAFASLL